MSNIAIKVENLSKLYTLGQARSGSLYDTFGNLFKSKKKIVENSFWALDDLNFEIKHGDAVGIVGRNGAGKSTLLKVLSRITQPTKGKFTINGRVSSLLEVGTGFHPELSGRENIFLNGTILGMSRPEIKSKLDEIVAFSGVEKFLDTPVKHYSSGMYVRLAFAVAAHLEPEILIIDEVLAVGDAEFQKKCLGKMQEVAGEGRTVLFVSHNMSAVKNLCNKGILLDKGSCKLSGDINDITDEYFNSIVLNQNSMQIKSYDDEKIQIKQVKIKNQNNEETSILQFDDDLVLEFECFTKEPIEYPQFWIAIKSAMGNLFEANALNDGAKPTLVNGSFNVTCHFKNLHLSPQLYTINMGIKDKIGDTLLTRTKEIGSFKINFDYREKGFKGDYLHNAVDTMSPVFIPYTWNFDNKEYFEFK